jgi:uncharacterized protein YukE
MSLPSFAYRWVGGDISGLESFKSTCTSAASGLADVDQALSGQVSRVVGAAGWSGSAADAFSTAWDKDSKAGSQLADAWTKIGSIVDNLAQQLASLEHQLEQAAYDIEKQGITINAANGTIMPEQACLTPQATAKDAQLANEYNTVRGEILAKAEMARSTAATQLDSVTESMVPPGTDWGLVAAGLDGMRGLWAAPTTYNRDLAEKLAEAKEDAASTRSAAFKEMIEAKKVYGNAAKLSPETRGDLADTSKELSTAEGKLADAPAESALTQLADGDAGGLGASGLAAGAVRGIPYAGALAGAVITTAGDRSEGESWGQSISDGVVSNGTALAAGMGAAAVIGTGSMVAVAGGVVVGGVVAVGVGDLVHEAFQENWSQDIHDHGVVDGLADGTGHVFANTGKDLYSSGKSIVHGIESLF